MEVATISIYDSIKQTKNGKNIPVDIFLQYVQEGKWQDEVLAVRNAKSDEEQKQLKEALPYATISGKFAERKNSGLEQHSGFLCIDIDDVEDPNELKSILCPDKYVYAAFVSVSGKGLAVLVKINPEKHAEAFAGLQEYFYTQYQQIIDPSCKDVSRPRFVSWDPHLYTKEKAVKFATYPKKLIPAAKNVKDVIYVRSDFDAILQEIEARREDITGDYHTWLRIGFALADHFGETGRDYFHHVSQFHPSYDHGLCDKQFTKCLKAGKSGVGIATFYYHVKQAGIQTVSARTQKIAQAASFAKKGRRTRESAQQYLDESEGIDPSESGPVIDQVFSSDIAIESESSQIEEIEDYLRFNYEFKLNLVTRHVEMNGIPMRDRDMNTIWKECAKVIEKVNKSTIEDIINSDFTKAYNPLHDFFERHKERRPYGVIKDFLSCINTDTGMQGTEFCPEYLERFTTKWLVGIVSSAFGKHSPLMLVFTGRQGNGKTEFFRRLLPDELQPYFAESKMQAGKDDEILMACRLVLMDDELSGKSHKEEKKLKYLLSKDMITLREPFGKRNVDLKRLAVFCGTTNEPEVLNDPTGNRRIIPVNVISIDYDRINKIDRIDLMMEAYWLWKDGFKWEMSSDDISILNSNTSSFEQFSIEYEMIMRYYRLPKNRAESTPRTATDIATALHRITGNGKLSKDRIVKELRKIGFDGDGKYRIDGYNTPRRAYLVFEVGHADGFITSGTATA